MPDFQEYLDLFAGKEASLPQPETKTTEVNQRSTELQKEVRRVSAPLNAYDALVGRYTNNGRYSASEVENDFLSLTPFELQTKYGADASALIQARGRAEGEVAQDRSAIRTNGEFARDSAVSAGLGFFNSFAGIAALGMQGGDLIADKLAGRDTTAFTDGAASVSNFTDDINEIWSGPISDALESNRNVVNAANRQASRDNQAIYADQIAAGADPNQAKVERLIRDFGDAGYNVLANPEYTADTVASGVGSLLSGSVIAGGVRAVGRSILGKAGIQLAGKSKKVADIVGDYATMPAVIAAQESGGTYQQTMSEALDILKERTDLTQSEKNALASEAALIAAETQAPVAAVTGILTARFEANPFRTGRAGSILQNAGKEAVEETIQSGTSQYGTNLGIQSEIDPDRDLYDQVGTQAAIGAIGGFGTGPVLQAPGAVVGGTVDAIGDTARSLAPAGRLGLSIAGQGAVGGAGIVSRAINRFSKRKSYDELLEENRKNSPISEERVGQDFDEILSAQEAIVMDIEAESPEALPVIETLLSTINDQGDGTLYDQILSLAQTANDTTQSEEQRLVAAGRMAELIEAQEQIIGDGLDILSSKLDEESSALQKVSAIAGVLDRMRSMPSVKEAMAFEPSEQVQTETQNDIIIPDDIAASTVALSTLAPEKVSPAIARAVLAQREDLTPDQRIKLQAAITMAENARNAVDRSVELGLTRPVDAVSEMVTTGNAIERGFVSGKRYVSNVVNAVRQGRMDEAKENLKDFADFAQHMQNKVGALNAALASGSSRQNAQKFQALNPLSRVWFESTGPFVDLSQPGSIRLAQRIGIEAQAIGQMANDLIQMFPDLGIEGVALDSLDSSLNSPAEEISDAFNQQKAAERQAAVAEIEAREQARREQELEAELQAKELADQQARSEEIQREQEQIERVEQEVTEEVVTEAINDTLDNSQENTPQEVEVVSEPESEPEPQAAPSESSEPEPDGEVAPSVEDEVQEPTVSETPKGMDAIFPNLWGGTKNFFKRAFQLPANPRVRFINDDQIFDRVLDAMGDLGVYLSIVGTDGRRAYTSEIAEAYADFLGDTDATLKLLQEQLTEFLEKNDGEDRHRWLRGRALNIAEEDGTYNPELIEKAVLAAYQWLIDPNNHFNQVDEKQAAEILNIEQSQVSNMHLIALSAGSGTTQAIRSLASTIERFWGLKKNNSVSKGYTEGISDAVAGEILRAFVKQGFLQKDALAFQAWKPEGKNENRQWIATPNEKPHLDTRYQVTDAVKERVKLQEHPTAIEHLVVLDPVETDHIGTPPKTGPKTQLRSKVPLTDEQIAAEKAERETPHYADRPMIDFYLALGREGLLRLFGSGPIEEGNFNTNHYESLEGKNRQISASFDKLVSMVSQIQNVGTAAGQQMDQVPVYYGYEFASQNRMQMQGAHNPQANKIMREAILPTWSTLDLNTSEGELAFFLAIGQAIGVKIHNLSNEEAVAETKRRLGKMKSLPELTGGTEYEASIIDALRADLGGDLSPAAVHALMEYSRSLRVNDKSNFRTSLYVEADGVTNGPVNAMMLMTSGKFTPKWFLNMARGGFFVSKFSTLDQRWAVDKIDLYGSAGTGTERGIQKMFQDPKIPGEVKDQLYSAVRLMGLLMPKDIVFNPDGTITITRGAAKNPLTITIYGSSENGIAGNFMKEITDKIYERISNAVAAGAKTEAEIAQAMFSDKPDPVTAFREYQEHLGKLTDNVVRVNRKGELYVAQAKPDNRGGDRKSLASFTFSVGQKKALQANLLKTFVEPMVTAIDETLAGDTLFNAKMIRTATQIQGIFFKYDFQAELGKKLKEKAKDPEWKEGDFLSENEINEVLGMMLKKYPMIASSAQNILVSGSQSTTLNRKVLFPDEKGSDKPISFGRDFAEDAVPASQVYGPRNPGVAGIPLVTISFGDGRMMQILSTMDGAPTGTLKVFDGMHMKLSSMFEDSKKANQAVWESWQQNPIKAVADSFREAKKNFPSMITSRDMMEELQRAYDGYHSGTENTIQAILDKSAMEVEARHRALARVKVSVDQMASISSPFQNEGANLEDLTEADLRDVAERLEQIRQQELAALEEEALIDEEIRIQRQAAPREPFEEKLRSLGRRDRETGAQVLSFTSQRQLRTFLNATGMGNADQRQLLADLVRSERTRDYKIVFGNPEEVDAFAQNQGDEHIAWEANVHGLTSIGSKTIYLYSASVESLVHEMIHAATYETVAYYMHGWNLGRDDAIIGDAIENIAVLAEQFSKMVPDPATMSFAQQQAMLDAQKAMADARLDYENEADQRAAALNEFMAWALANEQLVKLGKQTKASKIATMARNVIDKIKAIIWGNKRKPKVEDDLFSNLLFNTQVVINGRNNVTSFADTVLQMKTSELQRINDILNDKVARYISEETLEKTIRNRTVRDNASRRVNENIRAIRRAHEIAEKFQAAGFSMNPDEKSTFEAIVAAMATGAELDGASMVRLQELYNHVQDKLKLSDFHPENPTPEQEHYAQERFNAIAGIFLVGRNVPNDDLGRTALLSSFLALGLVNPEFKKILAGMDLPQKDKSSRVGLDGLIENVGITTFDKLSRVLANQDKNTDNVQDAIGELTEQLVRIAQDRQTWLDQTVGKVNNVTDGINDFIVSWAEKLAKAAATKAREIRENSDSRFVETSTKLVEMAASLMDVDTADQFASDIIGEMSTKNIWKPFYDFIKDIVGRTETNAGIYDMIKMVSAMVARDRQQYRDHLPRKLAERFSRELTEQEWSDLYHGLAKTDFAALLQTSRMNQQDALEYFRDPDFRSRRMSELEEQIRELEKDDYDTVIKKSEDLARFMMRGIVPQQLWRNAYAIGYMTKGTAPSRELVNAINEYVTLRATTYLSEQTLDRLSSLAQNEAEGMAFSLAYLGGIRRVEIGKILEATDDAGQRQARMNHYKGFVPSEQKNRDTLVVAPLKDDYRLIGMGFRRVAMYEGSSHVKNMEPMAYYYLPVQSRSIYNQGISQNIHNTAGGVSVLTGYTVGGAMGQITIDRITDPAQVRRINRLQENGRSEAGAERLMPIMDENGQVVAYEYSTSPVEYHRVARNDHFGQMMGAWKGRQVEEAKSQIVNRIMIERLKEMYDADLKRGNKDQYIDLFAPSKIKDPVLVDGINLMTAEMRQYAQSVFGDQFMVHKSMVEDVLGYRQASVGDLWTGTSRLSEETRNRLTKMAGEVFGNDAYRYLVKGEEILQNFVSDAKMTIVIKSVIVPVSNFLSNILQLMARGVPMMSIFRAMPRKITEIRSYAESSQKKMDLEAELVAVENDPIKSRALRNQIAAIDEIHRRLSIWPLIEAGEFNSISDADIGQGGTSLYEGKLGRYIEEKVDKLPDGIRTLGRYAWISRDTALYQAMQHAVEYGDFLGKAILYDDLIKRKQLDNKGALTRITEEFVNYDRLPGRFRGYVESVGLLWFWNFKMRSMKTALSMLRNNPLHVLLAMQAPMPTTFGTIGSPLTDNLGAVMADGRLDYSMGFGQAFRAYFLNPWYNLVK